jgi:hypothetical protein
MRPKAVRMGEDRERHAAYMKEYMREKRARQKAEERTSP